MVKRETKRIFRRLMIFAAPLFLSSSVFAAAPEYPAASTTAGSFSSLITVINSAAAEQCLTIDIAADFEANAETATIAADHCIIINGNDHTLWRNSSFSGSLFTVQLGGYLEIHDYNFSGTASGWSVLLDKSGEFPELDLSAAPTASGLVASHLITSSGTMVIDHAHFSNFASNDDGAVIAVSGSGTNLDVLDSSFSHNYSAKNGAAIMISSGTNEGIITIDSSSFNDNVATNGGAIYRAGSATDGYDNILVQKSFFQSNYATNDAGAIFGMIGHIKENKLYDNFAGQYGGALRRSGNMHSEKNEYVRNGAGSEGGAFYSLGAEFTDDTFDGNYSKTSAGAVRSQWFADFVGCTFINNYTLGTGGAIDGTFSKMVDTNISHNTASTGGGVFVRQHSLGGRPTPNIINTTISDNSAIGSGDQPNGFGGGIVATGAPLTFDSAAKIYNNTASAAGDDIITAASGDEYLAQVMPELPPVSENRAWYIDNPTARFENPDSQQAVNSLASYAFDGVIEAKNFRIVGLKLASSSWPPAEEDDASAEALPDNPATFDGFIAALVTVVVVIFVATRILRSARR